MVNQLFEIIKLILPAGIVFLTTYYLIKTFFAQNNNNRVMDVKLANQKIITPIRLESYERIVLFLERINPSSMVMRINKTLGAPLLHAELLKTVRSEFEHNLSQQIYMSNKSWEAVIKAKEETIKLINVAATMVGPDSSGMELAQAVITVSARLTE